MDSDKTTIEVKCPECGHTQKVEIDRGLNAGRFTHFRSQILDGSYGKVKCPECAVEFYLQVPFFYTDSRRNQWFACYPPQWENRWKEFVDEANAMVKKNAKDLPPALAEAQKDLFVRVVFGIRAMREKLIAAEASIDDLHLEALKMGLIQTNPDVAPLPSQRPRLVDANSEALLFSFQADGKGVPVEIPRKELDLIIDNPDSWGELMDLLSDSIYVDLGKLMFEGEEPEKTA